jgi:hypothetical protein
MPQALWVNSEFRPVGASYKQPGPNALSQSQGNAASGGLLTVLACPVGPAVSALPNRGLAGSSAEKPGISGSEEN